MSTRVLWFTSIWEMTSHSSWVQSLNILLLKYIRIFSTFDVNRSKVHRRSSFLESHMFVPDLFNHSLFKRNFDILTPLWPSMIINIMHSGPVHIELLATFLNWEPQQSLCCPIECGAWVLKCRGIANSHVQHKNKKKIYIWMFRKKKGMRFIFQLDTANFGPQYKSRNYFNLKND